VLENHEYIEKALCGIFEQPFEKNKERIRFVSFFLVGCTDAKYADKQDIVSFGSDAYRESSFTEKGEKR